jgi:alkanesulfonate monooxygenase SsuD/methylene tetrahydromethanopterin reductase-like flavin-dependent oxidoreductase (luciferase family)
MLRRSIVFAVPEFLPLVEVARHAEAAGYYRIWTTENPGRDALIRALTVALRTESIQVATGIAYAFTRAPLGMAATAADVQVASGGRFSLGIGAGTQGMRARWYGIDDFEHPATRLVEYADVMRKSWAASKSLIHGGRFYQAAYHEFDGLRPSVPIWGSGTNPVMLKIAARAFDGVALHPLAASISYLDDVACPALSEGAAQRTAKPEIALWRITCVHPDETTAAERARRSLAFYFSTPSYGAVAESAGWGHVSAEIRDRYRDYGPDWEDLQQRIPDGMVEEFCLVGTPSNIRARWESAEREYATRGATEVVFQIVTGDGGLADALRDFHAAIDALAPQTPGVPSSERAAEARRD